MSSTIVAGDGGGREGEGKGRGGLTGKTPAAVVKSATAAGLPAELGSAVLGVTGKTKLWNSERTEVARELCSHFFEGLEQGAGPTELSSSFGEPKQAARLITRAKKRNRPWAWRAMRRTVQSVAALFALVVVWYGWEAARFYFGSPTIRFNIQAEMNVKALAVPVADRAWPMYRDAFRAMKRAKFAPIEGEIEGWPVLKPGTPAWAAACAAHDKMKKEIDLLRRATNAPKMAYVLRSDVFDAANMGAPDGEEEPTNQNPLGIGVLLPQLGVSRSHARVLAFEVRRAAAEGRSADAAADIERLLAMAHQCVEDGTLISQLVEMAIMQLTAGTLADVVREHPALLTDAQLQRLAHVLGGYVPGPEGSRPWSPDVRLERRVFDDLLQRFYTDNGDGDGRLCKGVLAYETEFGVRAAKSEPYVQPIVAGVVAGRAEMRAMHEQLMDRFAAEAAKPLYQRDQTELDADVESLKGELGLRNSLALLCSPPNLRIARTFDETRTLLDGVVAGLAVELYMRRNGRPPTSWAELVPSLLPTVPIDPWTGKAMIFKPADKAGERPLIYSIGADLVDDGGKRGSDRDPARVQLARAAGKPAPTWDLVVWPSANDYGVPPMEPAAPTQPKKSVYRWGWVGSMLSPAGGIAN